MLTLFRFTDAPWEESRGFLNEDLQHIEAAINQFIDQTFTSTGTINNRAIATSGLQGDARAATRYVANTGADRAPMWDQVDLSNGVKDRLPFAHLQVLAPSKLLGRGSGAGTGDPEPITLGTGLVMSGTTLNASGGGGSSTQGIPSMGGEGDCCDEWIVPGPQGAIGPTGATGASGASLPGVPGPPGLDGEEPDNWVIPGLQGPQGPQGDTGASGTSLPGAPGPPGTDGEDGEYWPIPGPPGPSGGGGGGSGNITSTGAIGSEPGSPAAGDLYFPANGLSIERYSGSIWVPWGPVFPFTDPSVAGPTTWVNQGTATISTTRGGVILTGPTSGGEDLHARVKAAPATPYTITIHFIPSMLVAGANNGHMGVCFRESSSGRLTTFGFSAQQVLGYYNFTSPTVFSSSISGNVFPLLYATLFCLRIADDGTNRIASISYDGGVTFLQISTVARTSFLTADQVGYYVNPKTNASGVTMTLLSWVEA